MQSSTIEQRQKSRTQLSWPVSIWLPEANRFFQGRSRNISQTGVYIQAPVSTPVKEGQVVEINFPRSDSLARQKGQYARIKTGTVVRVERRKMFSDANVGVAVQFNRL